MMAGLLLVFVLIISFTILQAKTQYEAKEEELAEQALIIYAQQEELASKEGLLDDQQTQLDEQQSELDAARLLLQTQQEELDENKSAVEVMRELLANQEAELAAKQAVVDEQQEELAAQQEEIDRIIGVKADLIEGGFEPTTPVAVVYKATWPDQKILHTTLENLPDDMKKESITKTAMIVVGHVLGSEYKLSKLYDPTFSTEFREATE